MRLLARGLPYLTRTIPTNVKFIARIHATNLCHQRPPKDPKYVTAIPFEKPSSPQDDKPIVGEPYFYSLPDPVLDDTEIEDFGGELGPKTRILETKAPDIYPDDDVEELWTKLKSRFTEEDFEKLERGDKETEEKLITELDDLIQTQGIEGIKAEDLEGLEDGFDSREELEDYLENMELGGQATDDVSLIPNLSTRYVDLEGISEFTDDSLVNREDLRQGLKILYERVQKESSGEKGEHEMIQQMLCEAGDIELGHIADTKSPADKRNEVKQQEEYVGEREVEEEYGRSQLQQYNLQFLRRSHQTGKGKIASWYVLTVVGDGRGLVGLGEGKSSQAEKAREYALAEAKRNMDYVDRFENRTLWTDMESKFGATKLIMRPRPVGFGLMCAPGIHQVLKAAGIKDASAKIWGSRNKIVSVKLAVKMLHAGHQPLGFGNGIGGRGGRLEKGVGMRNKMEVERERGRRIVDARTW